MMESMALSMEEARGWYGGFLFLLNLRPGAFVRRVAERTSCHPHLAWWVALQRKVAAGCRPHQKTSS